MKSKTNYQHNPFFYAQLLPAKNWKVVVVHMLVMVLVVFLTEISNAQANGLFDFQMKLAQKGNAEAQYKVGEMYETGFGITKDMEQAKIWIDKAAAQGHVVAGYKLLYWDLQKQGVKPSNESQMQQLLKKSDEADAGPAKYYVGKMYANGIGVKKDTTKALALLNKASLLGSFEAEREITAIKEKKSRAQFAKQQAEKKRKAWLKAKREKQRRDSQPDKQQGKVEEARQRAISRQQEQAGSHRPAVQDQVDEMTEEQRQLLAEKEARRQALLSQRKQKELQRKQQFESDPCAGKSARFLSTCR